MARYNDLVAGIRMGEVAVTLVASGTPYSPDVADDMARRCLDLWYGTLDAMDSYDLIDASEGCDPELDDEDEVPTPKRELQDPRVVRFLEKWGDDLA